MKVKHACNLIIIYCTFCLHVHVHVDCLLEAAAQIIPETLANAFIYLADNNNNNFTCITIF